MTTTSPAPIAASDASPMSCEKDRVGNSINRVIEVLTEETEALRVGGPVDMVEFSRRKGQRLIELSRIIDRVSLDGGNHDDLRRQLDDLKRHTAENATMLRAHMTAVEDVVQIVQSAIEGEASDGTYSRRR